MKKARALAAVTGIYLLAYAVGIALSRLVSGEIARYAVFDAAATVVVFVFSVLLGNSSVYDPYWSLTPMLMALCLFVSREALSVWHLVFLGAFLLWGLRLTWNWCTVFTDFSYEDWRYRMYRSTSSRLMWPVINFWGIHMVPTIVVFAGMLPLFALTGGKADARILPGTALVLAGTALEFFADRAMHAFLRSGAAGRTCRAGLWRYSRHPNYLGEMTVWVGTAAAMLPLAPEKWYLAAGALPVIALFNAVSVPLMEKRQRTRRADYADYCRETSRLLLLPPRGKARSNNTEKK